MARIYTEGFESGDILFFTGPSGSAITTTPRSGVYCCDVSGSSYKLLPSTYSEFYLRGAMMMNSVTSGPEISMDWYKGTTVLGKVRVNNNHLDIVVGTGVVATGTRVLLTSTWYLIEVHVKIADSGGEITAKIESPIGSGR